MSRMLVLSIGWSCDLDVGRVGVGLDKSANGLGFRGPANYKLPVAVITGAHPGPQRSVTSKTGPCCRCAKQRHQLTPAPQTPVEP